MKRIIDGAAYDTATAIKIALHRKQADDDRQVTHYQTGQGEDFYHVQNYEGSAGHLQHSIEPVPDSYWHETYPSGGEGGENGTPAQVRVGDRRITPRPDAEL